MEFEWGMILIQPGFHARLNCNLQAIGGWFQAAWVNPSHLCIIRIYSTLLWAYNSNKASQRSLDLEDFLAALRVEQRSKLEELPVIVS